MEPRRSYSDLFPAFLREVFRPGKQTFQEVQAGSLFDLVMDGIHEDEGVDTFQRPILPSIDLRHDLLGNLVYQFRRDIHTIEAFDPLSNITLAHATSVQRQYFVFHALGIAVELADDFWLTLAVSGNLGKL